MIRGAKDKNHGTPMNKHPEPSSHDPNTPLVLVMLPDVMWRGQLLFIAHRVHIYIYALCCSDASHQTSPQRLVAT